MITTTAQLRDITPAMRETWLFIAAYIRVNRQTPRLDDICQQFNLSDRADAQRRLDRLEKHGIIIAQRNPCVRRNHHDYLLFVWPVVRGGGKS